MFDSVRCVRSRDRPIATHDLAATASSRDPARERLYAPWQAGDRFDQASTWRASGPTLTPWLAPGCWEHDARSARGAQCRRQLAARLTRRTCQLTRPPLEPWPGFWHPGPPEDWGLAGV